MYFCVHKNIKVATDPLTINFPCTNRSSVYVQLVLLKNLKISSVCQLLKCSFLFLKITAKTAEAAGQIFLYENIDRGGRNIPFDVDAFGLNVPDIGTYSFNDRLSSFEMVLNLSNTYVVTLFRDQNYQGRPYSFNGRSLLYIRNLGDYVMTNRFPGDITWNDQMTSFKVSVYANN